MVKPKVAQADQRPQRTKNVTKTYNVSPTSKTIFKEEKNMAYFATKVVKKATFKRVPKQKNKIVKKYVRPQTPRRVSLVPEEESKCILPDT